MSKKKRNRIDAAAALRHPVITFRTLDVCFTERTVTIDGRRYGPIENDCFSMPILSGDAVFIPRGDLERIS